MTAWAIDALLVMVVAAVWLGCLGFVRLRSPLDRLHCTALVNATAGVALTLIAFLADGASARALKVLAITVVSLLAGAATSHAVGRALVVRAAADDPDRPGAGAAR